MYNLLKDNVQVYQNGDIFTECLGSSFFKMRILVL